jgi:hypothetical protein
MHSNLGGEQSPTRHALSDPGGQRSEGSARSRYPQLAFHSSDRWN